jgi:argininosuccinate lyase
MATISTNHNQNQDGLLFELTNGLDVDQLLYKQEIRVQKAWIKGLAEANYLTPEESETAQRILSEAQELIEAKKFDWRIEDEDIHMNLERFMTEKAGILGKKIHLGRSRNDLIATTLRLYVHDEIEALQQTTKKLISAFISQADENFEVIIPGMTHLQNGQPIRWSHTLAAHGWSLSRDLQRMEQVKNRCLEAMPQGAAACTGSPLPLNFEKIAKELGFKSPCLNSYDAVGDRDFMLEALDACAMTATHLSRWCEETMFYSASSVRAIQLPPAWSTGSSIMPNKRNPDVLELMRAKTARIISLSAEGKNIVRTVIPSYGSDLHESKRTLMTSLKETSLCLRVAVPFVTEMKISPARAKELLEHGHILATEVADHLTSQGVPFRDAYKKVAALVSVAEQKGVQVHALDEETWKTHAPEADQTFLRTLSFESAVERRSQIGGTSLSSTKTGLAQLRQRIHAR